MFIWRGWGVLALLLLGAGGGGGTGIGIALGGASSGGNWGTCVGFGLAAPALWIVGQALNKPKQGFHPTTGKPATYRNWHTLFWIPVQYYAVVAAMAAIWVLIILVSR